MLFQLNNVPNHGIYALHADVLNFFYESISRARFTKAQLYTPSLRNVVDDSNNLDDLFKRVFRNLNVNGINKQMVYDIILHNNDIQRLLTDNQYQLRGFPDDGNYNALQISISALYSHLWSSTLKTDSCGNNYGSIRAHYQQFDVVNMPTTNRICAFCGLKRLENPNEKINSYDHYLHQDSYPFLRINFNNLVPMCDTCNERPNKGTENMILANGARRTAFYPYDPILAFNVNINSTGVGDFANWAIMVSTQNPDQRFDTWKTVFKIDSRYTNHLRFFIDSWLKNLYAYIRNNFPLDSNTLLLRIGDFVTFRLNSARDTGDFIEFRFWDIVSHLQIADIDVLHQHLTQQHQILTN